MKMFKRPQQTGRPVRSNQKRRNRDDIFTAIADIPNAVIRLLHRIVDVLEIHSENDPPGATKVLMLFVVCLFLAVVTLLLKDTVYLYVAKSRTKVEEVVDVDKTNAQDVVVQGPLSTATLTER